MMAPLLSLLAPAGADARLSVLIFHRVLAEPDPLFPDEMFAARFDQLCGWLRRWFEVLPLPAAQRQLREQALPARALAITFDDGYADNHDIALPILQRHGLCATFFVATGFLDGGRMWNDTLIEAIRLTPQQVLDLGDLGLPGVGRLSIGSVAERRQAIDAVIGACKYLPLPQRIEITRSVARVAAAALPDDLMMRSDQVLALQRAGMAVGGHTVHHPILSTLDREAARGEIESGKAHLEGLLQEPVTLFAYPNGKPGRDFNDESVTLVRDAGFEAAVTTGWGAAGSATDRYRLPRFTPWDRSRWAFGLRMARNLRVA